jgi:hypothetical protein
MLQQDRQPSMARHPSNDDGNRETADHAAIAAVLLPMAGIGAAQASSVDARGSSGISFSTFSIASTRAGCTARA